MKNLLVEEERYKIMTKIYPQYPQYVLIKYMSLSLRWVLVLFLLLFPMLSMLNYPLEVVFSLFSGLIIMFYFILRYVDVKGIAASKKALFDNEELIFENEKPQPGTTLMNMLKQQKVTCEDIQSIKFMACSLQHWCDYYQDKLIDQGYELSKIKSIEVYGFDDRGDDLTKVKMNNIHFFPTKEVLVQHTNLIKLKDNRLFMCYEPKHIIFNGEDELKYGSFLVEIKSKNFEKVERSFLNEMNYMRKVA